MPFIPSPNMAWIDTEAMPLLIGKLERAEATLQEAHRVLQGRCETLGVDGAAGTTGLSPAMAFVSGRIADLRRRLALAVAEEAGNAGVFMPGMVLLDTSGALAGFGSPEEAEAEARRIADELLDSRGDPSDELIAELRAHAADPYFASAFAKRIPFEDLGPLLTDTATRIDPRLLDYQERLDRYNLLVEGLGSTLATATRQTAPELRLPDDYADDWLRLMTDGDAQDFYPAAAAQLLRHGSYGTDFLDSLATGVYEFELENPNTPWGNRLNEGLLTRPGAEHALAGYPDPMTGIMEALGNNPAAALRWFDTDTERLRYVIQDRIWPSDNGAGAGRALEAATTVFRGGTLPDPGNPGRVIADENSPGWKSANLASHAFAYLGERIGDDTSSGFPWVGSDRGRQVPTGMRESVGRMLSAYMHDIYRVTAVGQGQGGDPDVPGVYVGITPLPGYPAGALVDPEDLKQIIRSIAPDHEAMQLVVNSGLLMAANVTSWAFDAGVSDQAVDSKVVGAGNSMAFIVGNAVAGDIGDETFRAAERQRSVQWLSGLAGLVPVPGGKFVEYVVDQGRSGLAADLARLPGESARDRANHSDVVVRGSLQRVVLDAKNDDEGTAIFEAYAASDENPDPAMTAEALKDLLTVEDPQTQEIRLRTPEERAEIEGAQEQYLAWASWSALGDEHARMVQDAYDAEFSLFIEE